ncbi:DNA cytosine methyltransferase [uncultured Bacteroides sp.]|uniref:DNA cytosine methyltransferase n=1 Tax=uncultured Bacteroides sp. TaxID=162156 RepID=UPI002638BFA6|nr:DNA (cytosine-5-)-methyltransferase [uncultured Bacteroides sp.]
MKPKFTHASLFSGIGGPEIAAEMMGWTNSFHCEINPFGRKVLDYWFPNSKSYEDITKTDFTEWRGKINVLTGGFPCQPFSCAGQQKGADDDRHLWPEMLRAIREIQPDWVVGENVAGILTMVQPGSETALGCETSLFGEADRERVLHRQEYVVETVCSDIEREGYSVQPVVIPACAVGAPHRRDRIFFIARRNGDCTFQRTVTDTDLHRFGNRTNEQVNVKECEGKTNDSPCCKNWITPHSNGERCDNGRYNRRERQVHCDQERHTEGNQSERAERQCGTWQDSANASYPNGKRLQNASLARCHDAKRRKTKNRCLKQYLNDVRAALPADRWKDSQLNPLFVADMMGFPSMWTVFPFLSPSGDKNP